MPADPASGLPADPDPAAASSGSFWGLKPWWCQPWSILLSGVAAVAGSWLLLGRWWISLPLALAVGAWWGLFLVLVPAAWRSSQQGAASVPPPAGAPE